MPQKTQNNQSRLRSFRIPLSIDQQVEMYARERQMPLNRAFVEILTRGLGGEIQSDTPSDTPQQLADLEARLTERIAALEARFQSTPKLRGNTVTMGMDESRHHLGPLCERGHDWKDTGQSRRYNSNHECMDCKAERMRERRAKAKTAVHEPDAAMRR